MGIEPTSRAWEAPILPLNYARSEATIAQPIKGDNGGIGRDIQRRDAEETEITKDW